GQPEEKLTTPMNDFQELENELRALRPARPSPVLLERIEEAMVEGGKRPVTSRAGWSWRRFTEWSRGHASDIDGRLVRGRERGRCRWIDVLQQIRSRWRDAGRL